MSNLLVQNIKHTNNTTAQTIDTSGRTTAVLNNDTTYRSDAGAVTQNMVQGLAKCWVNFNGDSTVAIRDTQNVGSITDNGTGDYTVNLSNSMASADYAPFTSGDSDPSVNAQIPIVNFKSAGSFATFVPTSSAFRLAIATNDGTRKDNTYVHASNFGDLA